MSKTKFGALYVQETLREDGTVKTLLRAPKSDWVRRLVYLDGKPFDFSGRRYLEVIYNSNFSKKLLICGRQVEKCQPKWSTVTLFDGREVVLESIAPGDRVIGISSEGEQISNTVIRSEDNGPKRCLKIKTRLGSELVVTENHPLRKLLCWEEAANLKVGDRVASLRSIGFFGTTPQPLAALIGLFFGDGCFSSDGSVRQRNLGFTCKKPKVYTWFEEELKKTGSTFTYFVDKKSGSRQYSASTRSTMADWLKIYDLFGSVANTKVLPDECFRYDKPSTRELLRGLWATDGHCKNVSASKVDLVYCSTSRELARQVRLLLRKFGIITTLRTYQPKRGHLAYLLRVVTRKSIEAFHQELGPIPGKPFDIPNTASNSNLDTLPREVYDLFTEAKQASDMDGKRYSGDLDRDLGFRIHKKYAPTYEKIAKAQILYHSAAIEKVLDSDIIWDQVVSIEDAGELPTWSIQTESETYISDFLVNHNSTMLANEIIVGSAVQPFYKTLYVSPSHSQTRQFSNGKLKPWMADSPIIAKYLINSETSSQVFEKGLSNGSICFLRSAFLTADRARGISADLLCLDELQDLLTSNIPVIEECLSHAKDPREIMSGTPKTLENPIQQYWELSSMCEWLVPCERHTPFHYNYLDEKSIGLKGPICNKCGHIINPAKGQWIAFNNTRDLMGFRVSQVMVPWMYQSEAKWKELVWKKETYAKAQFMNECLGISYDSATKPITRTELVECCSSQHPFRHRPDRWTQNIDVFAGIDWGEGTDGSERGEKGKLKNASYTVLTMGAYLDMHHFHIFYYRRFTGKEALPGNCIPEIMKILKEFRVRCVGVDWGHGWGVNDRIEEAFGQHRVIKFQHVGSQRERKKYDPVGHKFQLARNEVMTDFFLQIKDHKIVWPDWESVKDYLCDFEHIYAEYSEYTRQMKYDHKPSEPDDACHSSIYCKEAADNYFGKNS